MAQILVTCVKPRALPFCRKVRCCICCSLRNNFSSDSNKNINVNTGDGSTEITNKQGVSVSESLLGKRGGFARAFEKYTSEETPVPAKEESFASLLKNSKFIDLGDPEGKLVEGTIYHVVDDDLYIDFGWKFPCVCTRPARNGKDYVRGAKVLLRIKDLELSSRFLGAERDLTLLEAEATLTALLFSPARYSR